MNNKLCSVATSIRRIMHYHRQPLSHAHTHMDNVMDWAILILSSDGPSPCTCQCGPLLGAILPASSSGLAREQSHCSSRANNCKKTMVNPSCMDYSTQATTKFSHADRGHVYPSTRPCRYPLCRWVSLSNDMAIVT